MNRLVIKKSQYKYVPILYVYLPYMTTDYNLILQVQIVFDNFKVRTDMLQPDNLKVNNITDKSSAWKAYGLVFDFILITNIFSQCL